MARIRILELPLIQVGEFYKTPFAIVIDQVDSETDSIHGADSTVIAEWGSTEITQEQADAFAKTIGAEGAILTAATLDVEV